MTAPNEQDRRIAAWFQDVHGRLPERTIETALTHARAHPRRRDPLAALRGDPMGSGSFGLGRRTQPLPLVAALGVLLAAAVAGAAVGGLFDREPSVVPPNPQTAPSPTPAPSPSGLETIRVDLIDRVGEDAYVDIIDESFSMTAAVSGDPGDDMNVEPYQVQVQVENDPTDPETIVLTWAGGACDTGHELVINADGRTLRMFRKACQGDSIGGVGHVLRLTFDAPAPAAEFDATLETTP